MIRVFPNRTRWTPTDELSFVGRPTIFKPPEQPVAISCVFTWDRPKAESLYKLWSKHYKNVQIGGPAYNDSGGEFTPGRFVKSGIVITSRGCIRSCEFCFVPLREGKIRELHIHDGWNIADNNLLACSPTHIKKVFEMLRKQSNPIEFSGGLDARLLRDWHIDLLQSIKIKYMFFACDSKQDYKNLEKIRKMLDLFSQNQRRCYVLIGFDPRESLENADNRCREVYELGFDPFAMLYQPNDSLKRKWSKDWRTLQRYWSRPAIYRSSEKRRVENVLGFQKEKES